MRRCAQGTEVCRSACVFGPEFRNVVQPQRPAYMHALSVLLGRLADEPVSPRAFQGLFRQPISCHRWCDSGHALCAGDRRCRRLEVTIQLERRFPRASGVFAVFGSVQLESFCLLAHHTHTRTYACPCMCLHSRRQRRWCVESKGATVASPSFVFQTPPVVAETALCHMLLWIHRAVRLSR